MQTRAPGLDERARRESRVARGPQLDTSARSFGA